jgi:hypothetical protein
MTKLSVIVRFRNEARYLDAVLRAVRAQDIEMPVEVMAVDNSSTDNSLAIASRYADATIDSGEYRPGAALNRAIEACSGSALVVVSAHAIPADRGWLQRLTAWLPNPGVLGTYGGQLYPVTSRFLDKRDLDIFSGLRSRTEVRDSDFWNANSTFLRSHWENEHFDETVFELEDHYWTKKQLADGKHWVRFEPGALVYHYGHEARNDRTFLPPAEPSVSELIAAGIAVLDAGEESWPAVMSAGLTLGSLSHLPEVAGAVPALGRMLLDHEDFDVRWRMAGALGRIGTGRAAEFLVAGLRDPSFYVRDECAWALGRLGHVGARELVPAADTLLLETRPFAALALGLTGCESARVLAGELVGKCLRSGSAAIVRDALYFLGEIPDIPSAWELAGEVIASLVSTDDDVARAAAWCWGNLTASNAGARDLPSGDVVELARRHPLETVRFEAVVALGKAARGRRSASLADEVCGVLRGDGAGRVRYGAMQSLRLMVADGLDCRMEAQAHDTDSDFGVLFERELILADQRSA